jgi:hypothetical protein
MSITTNAVTGYSGPQRLDEKKLPAILNSSPIAPALHFTYKASEGGIFCNSSANGSSG